MFAFSHVNDARWDDPDYERHYDRSWAMLGMDAYGPIVIVDESEAPYELSRQLLTNFATDNPHGCCGAGGTPQSDGMFVYEDVFQYIYTHPVSDHI